MPADGVRDLPDVSLMAGNNFYNATWLVCDDTTNLTAPACQTTAPCNQTEVLTSLAMEARPPRHRRLRGSWRWSSKAPAGDWVRRQRNSITSTTAVTPRQIFHDVTQGNNSVSCKQGSPNCEKNTAAYYFESGYNATAGYDLATGLGSVDAAQLINYWDTATSGITATVTVTPAPTSITANQILIGNRDGSRLSGSGCAKRYSHPDRRRVYLFGRNPIQRHLYLHYSGRSLSAGTDALTVTYSGDTNYASATGTATVTVTSVHSTSPSRYRQQTRPRLHQEHRQRPW